MTRRYCNDCERFRETHRLTKPAWVGIILMIVLGLNELTKIDIEPMSLWLYIGFCIGIPWAAMKDKCNYCNSTDTQKSRPETEKR